MDDFLIGSFMEVTGCAAPEDAAHHLHSSGWNLEEAVRLFFSIGAGTSGSNPSPPPSSPVPDQDAPIPARSETLYARAADEVASRSGPRWDSQTRVAVSSSSSSRRRRNMNSRRRRRERLREEEERNRQRRRVDDDDAARVEVDRDHSSRLRLYDQFLDKKSSGKAKAKEDDHAEEEKDMERMMAPPEELAFNGGFHAAKAHAARRARWLLVNVQDTSDLAFPTYNQNRDVWSSELVAHYVRDHFVLWRADAAAAGEDEARKICSHYRLQLGNLPAVVAVDPVTGQAMATLYGASRDPNDFLVAVRPYLTSKPVVPAATSASSSPAAQPVQQEPAINAHAPTTTSSQPTETPPPARVQEQQDKKALGAAAAVAMIEPQTVEPPTAPAPLLPGNKVCKLQVRLPAGRVVTKEFDGGSTVAALFAYCRSELGDAGNKAFRLMRLVGSARDQIADPTVSFDDSGLHLSTVSVLLG